MFKALNRRWNSAITAGMIEAGRMEPAAARLFGPLIEDMRHTKALYGHTQKQLVDAILVEISKKVVSQIVDAAKFTINILKRNLFERTADMGYLATGSEIVAFLKPSAQIDRQDESFREKQDLIYSQKISDPKTGSPLGVLCLCFDFKDEAERIFRDLGRGDSHIIAAILDEKVASWHRATRRPCQAKPASPWI